MVSAPLLYTQGKCGGDGEVTRQGQTSLEAEPGPGPPHSAQHIPSCQPASSSGPSLRPAGEDVDQILCPPTGPTAPPSALPASGGWHLSPLDRGQWSLDTPSHRRLSGPCFAATLSSTRAWSLPRARASAPLPHPQKLGRFHPGFCPDHRHKCCCLHGGAWIWPFPEHLNPHSFWGGRGGGRG